MKVLTDFFLSLRTTFGLLLIFVILLGIGSVQLTGNLAFFSGIDETPLFQWLKDAKDMRGTWWIYAMIATLTILALNTVFCTVEALLRRLDRKNLILKLSPQIMHIGILLIMFGHLITASIGFKTDILLNKGERKSVLAGKEIFLKDITVYTDSNGYTTDWQAGILWTEQGKKSMEGFLRPVHPLYFGNFGLYVKSVTPEPEASALIRVCSDPGALWALLGGVLLSAGGLGFLYGRFSA
ncbi:MAG: cytochrome c biogenesis protein ResB [Nitrospirae bacterium]|nr:cytochrome c biogenesis protein ResB [Nitrospirota bacterium]